MKTFYNKTYFSKKRYMVIDEKNSTKDYFRFRDIKNKYEEFHRNNGPAQLYDNKIEYWCKKGFYHRNNGPAEIYRERQTKTKYWWIYGISYTEQEYWNQ